MRIKDIRARIVYSTKSTQTIEIEIETYKGIVKASSPMGTSKGKFEVKEIEPKRAIFKFNSIKRNLVVYEIIELKRRQIIKEVNYLGKRSRV